MHVHVEWCMQLWIPPSLRRSAADADPRTSEAHWHMTPLRGVRREPRTNLAQAAAQFLEAPAEAVEVHAVHQAAQVLHLRVEVQVERQLAVRLDQVHLEEGHPDSKLVIPLVERWF